MTNFEGIPLSQRLEQGAMNSAEAVRAATFLADALRQYHDRGTAHGALEPCRIILGEQGAALLEGAASGITPYSSPEQVQGNPADKRSDIYAFGAIVYQMVSGYKPFSGNDWELKQAILQAEPAPLPATAEGLARLVHRCLTKSPSERLQRMQNVQMELKLLNVMARRPGSSAETAQSRMQAALRAEIAGLEERVMARIAALDQVTAELRSKLDAEGARLSQTATAAENLRAEIVSLESRVHAGDEEQAGRMAALAEQHSRIDQAVTSHGSSIESLGTALAQSDDLIERLVDAFDSLERSLEERTEGKAASAGAA